MTKRRNYRILHFLIVGIFHLISANVSAQLSSLTPVSMVHLDTPNNGSKNLANIEIVFSEPLQGAEIKKDSQNSIPDNSIPSTPTTIYAKAIALESLGKYAKNVTVNHPDFLSCVVDFESLGFNGNVKAGEYYRINVEVPDMPLVEANKAFSDLEFDKARAKYNEYIAAGQEQDAVFAQQRLKVMDELTKPLQYLNENASKTDKATKFRNMKAAEMIYNKTHSSRAYEWYQVLRQQLFGDTQSGVDEGVTVLTIDTVYMVAGDNRPMSDSKLPHVDGSPYYSWINVKFDLKEASFEGGDQFAEADKIDGDYRLYVPKGKSAAEGITLHQPDCVPLEIRLKDYGIDSIKAASVYVVKIKAPSNKIIEADRAFGNLDFYTAQMLYDQILKDDLSNDEEAQSIAASRMTTVTPLVENNMKTRWDELKKDVNLRGGPIGRDEICRKAQEMSEIAEKLAAVNVPGMRSKSEFYKKLSKDYRTAVFLQINAKEVNSKKEVPLDKDGRPLVYSGSRIELVFNGGGIKDYTVSAEPTSKGKFKMYLPERISKWIINNPGKKLKVTPKQRVYKKGKTERIGEDFEIELDGNDRSFSIDLFLQNKNT